jgi:hypothetical protein
MGQHEPAPTSAPVGSSVHWMGVGFLIQWMNVHLPLFTFLMLTVS